MESGHIALVIIIAIICITSLIMTYIKGSHD